MYKSIKIILFLLALVVFVTSITLIHFNKSDIKEVIILEPQKLSEKEKGLDGYIINVTKFGERGSILVANSINKSDLKLNKDELYQKELNEKGCDLTFYSTDNTDVINKLKYGQKVTIFNTGVVAFSCPGQTGISKIIIYN